MNTPHELINPDTLAPAIGFAHVVRAGPGSTIWLGGQTALSKDNEIIGTTFVEQFDVALGNVRLALEAAGAKPEHLVQMQLFVTDAEAYRASRHELGASYRKHLGRHYPAMALFEVQGLFDPKALIEIMGIAVVPAVPEEAKTDSTARHDA